MKKLISFSLWGNNPLYTNGAVWNAEHCKEFYPDWVCRFYHDDTVDTVILDKLKATGAELVLKERSVDVLGLYWRFHPMFDDADVERFIVRDTDSRFTQREVRMVDEWIASGKAFHIIRDCESHQTLILGGTWGALPKSIPDFDVRLSTWMSIVTPCHDNPRGLYHGSDQVFLGRFIWPVIVGNHLAHIRAGIPKIRYMPEDIEVDDPEDKHYVGMVV
jgi:hypothetical protein